LEFKEHDCQVWAKLPPVANRGCFACYSKLIFTVQTGFDDQMKQPLLDNQRLRRASEYIAAVLLSLLLMCFVLKLWRADLRVPLHYNGDALLHAMFIRGIIDNGWFWQNPALGAPGGLKMYDFPAVDTSAAIILFLISLFSSNAIVVLNIFYLLTFPLIAISSLYVLRHFNLSYGPSLFSSLLYTFLPYHFMRDESHLFLSAYYFIPLVVMVLLWQTTEKVRLIPSLVICAAVGSTGIYYPFFSCFLFLVAGVASALTRRRLRPLVTAAILVAATFTTVAINLSPSLVYLYRHGSAGVTKRDAIGAEIYGLKVTQLVLPVTGHRVPVLNQLKDSYNKNIEMTETDAAALGFIGTVGFLVLLAQLLDRRRLNPLLNDLSVLNIFAVLLGTVGGISSLFAVLVSAGLRSYNRISVFIAFFSLFAIALGLDQLYRRWVKTRSAQIVFYAAVAVVLLLGVLDQTTRHYVPDYANIKTEFLNDEQFVQQLEASVPSRAAIFQLPYVPFPEHPPVNKMVDYDHLRGYLHSNGLYWSYGTMKNREGDLWLQRVSALPTEELLETLSLSGFSGIYLDRNGYEDHGAAKEAELAAALQSQPLASANGRLIFFNLADYTRRLQGRYPEAEWQTRKEQALHPLMLDWKGGFSGLESGDGKTWRWCSSEGELRIYNTLERPRPVSLEMWFVSGHEQPADLFLSGLISEQLKVNSTPSFYSKTVTAPPGESVISFRSTAKRVDAPLDPRFLVFRIENFKLTELQK
jgi:phosphoglycerol transferase